MSFRRGRMYSADRIGDMGDPCGVPWFRMTSGRGLPLKDKVICQSVRKEQTQLQSEGVKPRIMKMCTRRSMWRLLKKPCMLNSRRPATCLDFTQVWTVCAMLKTASVAVW